VIRHEAVVVTRPSAPVKPSQPHHRHPLVVDFALVVESDDPIESPEVEAAAATRGAPSNEALRAGVATVGPGGGEDWHTHPDFVEHVYYVVRGTTTFWWKHEGEEKSREIGPGEFIFMPAASTHKWLNTGDEELELAFVHHQHNGLEPPLP
jgi:mannose-6-phosphate isomerase-like protein (cupin superfamily)